MSKMTVLQKIIDRLKKDKDYYESISRTEAGDSAYYKVKTILSDIECDLPAEEQQIRDAYKAGLHGGAVGQTPSDGKIEAYIKTLTTKP